MFVYKWKVSDIIQGTALVKEIGQCRVTDKGIAISSGSGNSNTNGNGSVGVVEVEVEVEGIAIATSVQYMLSVNSSTSEDKFNKQSKTI